MSQQSLGLGKDFSVTIECFYVATKFGQGQEFLCRDKVFLCSNRVGLGRGFYVTTKYSYVAIESSRTWGFPCRDIALYVAT